MRTTGLRTLGCVCAIAGATAALAQNLHLTRTADGVQASLPGGTLYWTYQFRDAAARGTLWQGDRDIDPATGVLLSTQGHVLGWQENAAQERAAAWDAPLLLFAPPAGDPMRPYCDTGGNAWSVVPVTSSSCLKARQSIGHTGAWNAVQTVPTGTSDIFQPRLVMDLSDNITVVFRSGYYNLRYVRYTPAGGWGLCQQFYSTGNFFQVIELGADAPGNVAAIFDQQGVRWTVYNAASGTWQTPQPLSPAGYSILLPTVLSNPAVDAMYAVYLVTGGGPVGLYAHHWDSATRTWGPAQYLPGTNIATFTGAGPGSRFPSVVGYDGEATVFWVDSAHHPHVSSTAGGIWQNPIELVAYEAVSPEDFASATASLTGEIGGVMSCWTGSLNKLYVFRHVPGTGWQPAENPRTTSFNKISRVRLGFYQGGRAVATMIDLQSGVEQLLSVLFNGSTWEPGFLDIPGTDSSYFSEIVSNRGEPLLVYEASVNEGSQGTKAAFLRDPHPGDLNCDGAVDFGDINPFVLALVDPTQYVQAHPDCSLMNGDINVDGSVDFADINPFIALLTGL
jgi:hypothetical protein